VVIITVRRMDKPRTQEAVQPLPSDRAAMIEAALAEMKRVADGSVQHAPLPLPGDRAVVKPSPKASTSTGHVDIISL
jgi:hypothetical protein